MKHNHPPNKFPIIILSLLLVFASTANAMASTYYVSSTGSDSNNGTSSAPWRTIQKSANTLVAGDTVIVYGGTYSERVSISRSGASGSPITFQVNPGDTVTVSHFDLNGNYITIDGFTVTDSVAEWNYGAVNVKGNYNIVQNCKVIHCNKTGISFFNNAMNDDSPKYGQALNNIIQDVGHQGVLIYGTYNTVSGNDISQMTDAKAGFNYGDCNGITVHGQHHTIKGNYVHNWGPVNYYPHMDCIQWFSGGGSGAGYGTITSDILIDRNRLENYYVIPESQGGTPVAQSAMMAEQSRNITVQNNIIEAVVGINIGYPGNNDDYVYIYNNTFIGDLSKARYQATNFAIAVQSIPHYDVRNNLTVNMYNHFYSANAPDGVNRIFDYHAVWMSDGSNINIDYMPIHHPTWGADPNFVSFTTPPNHGSNNYQLKSSSPCKDTGTAISTVTNAYAGTSRPQGPTYDLGAYEYLPSPTISAPKNVRIVLQ